MDFSPIYSGYKKYRRAIVFIIVFIQYSIYIPINKVQVILYR